VVDNAAPTWGNGAEITASDITENGFSLSYPAASDEFGVAKYVVTVTKTGEVTPVVALDTTATTQAITGLEPATEYTCTVAAKDATGNKSSDLTATVATRAPPVPLWAEGAVLTAAVPASDTTFKSLNVKWPEASGAVSYKLTYSNKTGSIIVTTNTIADLPYSADGYTITGLTVATRYDLSIVPVNAAGEGLALTGMGITATASTMIMAPSTPGTNVDGNEGRYSSLPLATKDTVNSTPLQTIYNLSSSYTKNNSRLFWYLQAGFNNTNPRNDITPFRLFDTTTGQEIALDYGTTVFPTNGSQYWTAYSATDGDDVITNQMSSGDFVLSRVQKSSAWVRIEFKPDKYITAGHQYALTIDPQFNSGGLTPKYLNKIYRYQFTVAEDSTPPAWGAGAEITASDITNNSVMVSYPAATDDVGVAKYTVTLTELGQTTSVFSGDMTVLNKTFTGLKEATQYVCTVVASDAQGNGSMPLTKTIGTLEPAPVWEAGAAITVSNITPSDASFNWPLIDKNIQGYELYINGVLETTLGKNDYYYDIGGLVSSTKYIVTLKPFNAAGLYGDVLTALFVTTGRGGMTFTTNPAATLKTSGAYTNLYTYSFPMDAVNLDLGWNFSNGIDANFAANLAGIRVYDASTGTELTLDKGTPPYAVDASGYINAGDFRYTKTGGGSGTSTGNVRFLEFVPGAATQAHFVKGKSYMIEFAPDFSANNGSATLGKIMQFKFQIAVDDFEAPAWTGTPALTATNIGPVSIRLNWPAATDNIGIKGYKLTINGTNTISIDAAATSYLAENLSRSTEYTFVLMALDYKNNESTPLTLTQSTSAADTVKPAWSDTSVLKAKNILTDNLDLSWTQATDDIGVTGYKIYSGGTLLNTVDAKTFALHVLHLVPGTSYTFRVEALDADGNESTTGPSLTLTTKAGEPDTQAPTFSGTTWTTSTNYYPGYMVTTLTWPWADDNVGVAGYNVYRRGTLIATVHGTQNSYTDTVASDNQDCDYQVFAFDAAGNVSATAIGFSVYTGATDYDITAPRWPAGANITLSEFTKDTVKVNFSQATDNREVGSYLLKNGQLWTVFMYKGEEYPGWWSFDNRTVWYNEDVEKYCWGNNYDALKLVEGQPTTFSVKAYDAVFNSTMYDPKITFIPGTNPTAGAGLPFSLSNIANSRGTLNSLTGAVNYVDNPTDPQDTELVFSFDCKLAAAYADQVSLFNAATNEVIPLDAASLIYEQSGTTSTLKIKTGTLANSTQYRVKFTKDLASSTGTTLGYDMQWEFTTAVADKIAPTWDAADSIDAAFKISPKVATLTWPQAHDNVGVTQYKIIKGSETLAIVPAATLTYDVENLDFETAYDFHILAGDYLNNWSEPLNKTVTTPPNTTEGHTWNAIMTFTDVNSDNVTIHWPEAVGTYAVQEYALYQGEASEPLAVLVGGLREFKATKLTGSTEYTFKVVAKDYLGNLSSSQPQPITYCPNGAAARPSTPKTSRPTA
jgi:hypothetical protein